jgi:hypothetical protein
MIGAATAERIELSGDDVIVYEINFYQPLRLHGWIAFRQHRQQFLEPDESRARERACTLAREHGVACYIATVDGELHDVDCAHYRPLPA